MAPSNKEISLQLAQSRRSFRTNGAALHNVHTSTAKTNLEQPHPHTYTVILNTLEFDSSGVVIFSDLVGLSVTVMNDAIAYTFQHHAWVHMQYRQG